MTPEEIQNDLLLCEETRNVGEDFTAKMIIAARCVVFVRDKAHRYMAEVQRLASRVKDLEGELEGARDGLAES